MRVLPQCSERAAEGRAFKNALEHEPIVLAIDEVGFVLVDELNVIESEQAKTKLLNRNVFDPDRAHRALSCGSADRKAEASPEFSCLRLLRAEIAMSVPRRLTLNPVVRCVIGKCYVQFKGDLESYTPA